MAVTNGPHERSLPAAHSAQVHRHTVYCRSATVFGVRPHPWLSSAATSAPAAMSSSANRASPWDAATMSAVRPSLETQPLHQCIGRGPLFRSKCLLSLAIPADMEPLECHETVARCGDTIAHRGCAHSESGAGRLAETEAGRSQLRNVRSTHRSRCATSAPRRSSSCSQGRPLRCESPDRTKDTAQHLQPRDVAGLGRPQHGPMHGFGILCQLAVFTGHILRGFPAHIRTFVAPHAASVQVCSVPTMIR